MTTQYHLLLGHHQTIQVLIVMKCLSLITVMRQYTVVRRWVRRSRVTTDPLDYLFSPQKICKSTHQSISTSLTLMANGLLWCAMTNPGSVNVHKTPMDNVYICYTHVCSAFLWENDSNLMGFFCFGSILGLVCFQINPSRRCGQIDLWVFCSSPREWEHSFSPCCGKYKWRHHD